MNFKIKTKMKANIFCILLAVGLTAVSCTPKETNDIYLCGNDSGRSAYYWVNGVKTPLSPECHTAQVSAIEVLDGDIYCAGYIREHEGDNTVAVYWKNGSVVRLTDGTCDAYAADMYVAYKAVCCVGLEADGPKKKMPRRQYSFDYDIVRHDRAKVWFRYDWGSDKELVLTDGEHHGAVTGVYVDPENGMHLVGYDEGIRAGLIGTLDPFYKSRYWRLRGEDWTLADKQDVFEHSGQATAVFGADTDVYICGWNDDDLQSSSGFDALYWKDGWTKNLPDNFEVVIEDGCVNGTDWYMCGYELDYNDVPHACYYKNGQAVKLSEHSSPVRSKIHAMAVAGPNVYMAGHQGTQPGYWKNDRFTPIESVIGGTVTGIVVHESWEDKE